MKRDIEMIRQILIDVEAHDSSKPCLQVSDYNTAYQVALMKDAGLVEAIIMPDGQGLPAAAALLRLTWTGHEFLDSSRDSTIWKMALDHVIKPGVSWTFPILIEWLKQEAKRRLLGVPTSSCDSTLPHVV
jgi:hypothetical protein